MESSSPTISCDLSGRDQWMIEVFASTNDAVFVTDATGAVSFLNQRAVELSGWEGSSAIGKPIGDIVRFSIGEAEQTALSSSPYIPARSPQEFSGKISLIRKDGAENPITGRAIPLSSNQGEGVGTLIILRDAAEEHRLVQAKDHFISIVAHQLRTPLGSARWCLDMLLSGDLGDLPEEARKAIANLHASNQQMIELVNDLLDMAKFNRTGGVEESILIDPMEVIGNVFRFLELDAQRRKVILGKQCDSDSIRVFVPRRRFYEVVRNLVSNAVKYSDPGERVLVSVSRTDGDRCRILVRDDGIGIPAGEQANIFSKFFRASNAVRSRTEGSGLGLATVKFFADAWGGRVWFKSVEGKGTTFFLELPTKASHEKIVKEETPS